MVHESTMHASTVRMTPIKVSLLLTQGTRVRYQIKLQEGMNYTLDARRDLAAAQARPM